MSKLVSRLNVSAFFHYPRRSLRLFNHDASKKVTKTFTCTFCKRIFHKKELLRQHYVGHIFEEIRKAREKAKMQQCSRAPSAAMPITMPIGRYLCCHCPHVDSLMTGTDLMTHINITHGTSGGPPTSDN